MTTTNKTLTNMNYFPTKQMFENNLSSITANEISFIKISDASIVDKLLGENGYIKYSNGLIIQWGWYPESNGITDTEHSWSFPITFPNLCFTCTTCEMFKHASGYLNDVYLSWSTIMSNSKVRLGLSSDNTGDGTTKSIGLVAIGY